MLANTVPRRGWLEKGDVINTRNLSELKKLIRKRK